MLQLRQLTIYTVLALSRFLRFARGVARLGHTFRIGKNAAQRTHVLNTHRGTNCTNCFLHVTLGISDIRSIQTSLRTKRNPTSLRPDTLPVRLQLLLKTLLPLPPLPLHAQRTGSKVMHACRMQTNYTIKVHTTKKNMLAQMQW